MKLLLAFAMSAVLAGPLLADPCPTANFALVDNTSCSIGSLDFTFTGTQSYGGGWGDSSAYFIPVTNGFSIAFLGGPQALDPTTNEVFDQFGINLTVADAVDYISGATATGGQFSASGTNAFATNGYISLDGTQAIDSGQAILCQPTCGALNFAYGPDTPLPTTLTGYAGIFDLWGSSGTETWDGSPTTYRFSADTTVPEPRVIMLLGAAVMMGILVRGKLLTVPR